PGRRRPYGHVAARRRRRRRRGRAPLYDGARREEARQPHGHLGHARPLPQERGDARRVPLAGARQMTELVLRDEPLEALASEWDGLVRQTAEPLPFVTPAFQRV